MKYLLISLFLTISYCCSALEFTSEPEFLYFPEFEWFDYLIETDAPEEDTITFSCLKKPDWLTFLVDPLYYNVAQLYGNGVFNLDDGGDTVIIEASNKDTSIFQEFVVWVDYPYILPDIDFWPSTNIIIDHYYDDTLIMSVWDPDSLITEIKQKPDWLNIQECPCPFPLYESISKTYRFSGSPVDVSVGDTFLVWIYFYYGAYEFSYYNNFIVRPESFLWLANPNRSLSIYPNPATNSLTFLGIREEEIRVCSLISVDGTMLEIIPHENTLDVEHLRSGLYFLQINMVSGETLTLKFVKE